MQNFASPQLPDIRRRVAQFIADELVPLEMELQLPPEDPLPREVLQRIWRRSHALGLYGVTLPRELGGQGLTVLDQCLLKLDIASTGAAFAPHVLGDLSGPPRVGSMLQYATPDQMARIFTPIIRGEKAICFAMTEPQSGSDAAAITTRGVVEGDEIVVSGHKHYISGAPFADYAIVQCVTDPDSSPKEVTAVLVDLQAPGVRVEHAYVPMSGQHIDADILLDQVRMPLANVLGGVGNGFKLGISRINVNRLLHCPTMLGLARHVYERSLAYARTRQQFGGPIARFQAIQHMLADMATALWACESMILHTAVLADQGVDIRMQAAACKLFVSERCFEIADKAVQIHGNVGVTKNHPVEQIFRKLRMYRIVTGTSEIQRNTIARVVLGQ